ncbi:MAG: hypothetical protein FJX29_14470 [Alphaproteobacteria bacterium]|nr:hypothetical protein [Alphaproteobacteria bacterium]
MHLLRFVLLGIAIGVAAIMGWRYVDLSFAPAPGANTSGQSARAPAARLEISPPQARQRIEATLASASEYAGFAAALRENFADVHERALMSLGDLAHENGRIETPDFYAAALLRALRQSHGVLAARASDPALERIFALHANVLSALSKSDPRLCADFLYGKASNNYFAFAGRNRELIAAMAQANFDAIIDGRRENIVRDAPRSEDIGELETQLVRKGLGQPEIEALLDGKTPDPPVGDAAMCKAGAVYFETLRDLPPETRLKIYATVARLLARS